jgi:hypothetical protein
LMEYLWTSKGGVSAVCPDKKKKIWNQVV